MATPVVKFQALKSKLDKLFLKNHLKLRWSTCKVIIHKLRYGVSLVEQDTIEYVSWPI